MTLGCRRGASQSCSFRWYLVQENIDFVGMFPLVGTSQFDQGTSCMLVVVDVLARTQTVGNGRAAVCTTDYIAR